MNIRIFQALSVFVAVIAWRQQAPMHEADHMAATGSKCVLSTASNGETFTVQGKVAHGAHDLMFEIPDCDEAVLLTFAGNKDNDVSATKLRRDGALKRFQKYNSSIYIDRGKTNCMDCPEYGDIEAELTGRLDIAAVPPGATRDPSGFLRDQSGKYIGTSGWGHPGPFARYRLVILSVDHVKAHKLPRPK